jgi:hypothetical protein
MAANPASKPARPSIRSRNAVEPYALPSARNEPGPLTAAGPPGLLRPGESRPVDRAARCDRVHHALPSAPGAVSAAPFAPGAVTAALPGAVPIALPPRRGMGEASP